MPEGHTLHRLAVELTSTFGGRTISATSPQGRFAAGALLIDGHTITDAEAYGKHLLVSFEAPEQILHIHLGLYGRLTVTPGSGLPVVGQVRLRIDDGRHTADLRGPTACNLLEPGECESLLARLGPDPLRSEADPLAAWSRISSSSAPIATLLMNQNVIAGVGNVYRAEVLFRLGIDPLTPGRALRSADWDLIWADLVVLMRQGVIRGRIDTVRAAHEPEMMGRPPRADGHGGEVYVYRRNGQPCLICGVTVRTKILANRNLFWCPGCQPSR